MSEDINDRLLNWGRVQRDKMRRGEAASLEGSYRSPQRWDESIPSAGPLLAVDDAAIIENAVCSLDLKSHAILQYQYVDRMIPVTLCRSIEWLFHGKVSMHPSRDLPQAMDVAISLLLIQLELPSVVRKQRAKDKILRIRLELGIDIIDDAA